MRTLREFLTATVVVWRAPAQVQSRSRTAPLPMTQRPAAPGPTSTTDRARMRKVGRSILKAALIILTARKSFLTQRPGAAGATGPAIHHKRRSAAGAPVVAKRPV